MATFSLCLPDTVLNSHASPNVCFLNWLPVLYVFFNFKMYMPFFSSPSFFPSLFPSFLSPRLGDLIDHSSNPNVVTRNCASMGKTQDFCESISSPDELEIRVAILDIFELLGGVLGSQNVLSKWWPNEWMDIDLIIGEEITFFFLGLQNHCGLWLQPWNEKILAPWKKNNDKPKQCKQQRHHFANKGLSSQSYGFFQ